MSQLGGRRRAARLRAPAARRPRHHRRQGAEEEPRRSATPRSTALADDLRRYLEHEPISARPDTLAYRAAKFVRRHRRGVAAGRRSAAPATVLLHRRHRVAGAREDRRQRDEASLQMARATAAREFMGFLLSAASTPGTKPSSGDLLAQSEAQFWKL